MDLHEGILLGYFLGSFFAFLTTGRFCAFPCLTRSINFLKTDLGFGASSGRAGPVVGPAVGPVTEGSVVVVVVESGVVESGVTASGVVVVVESGLAAVVSVSVGAVVVESIVVVVVVVVIVEGASTACVRVGIDGSPFKVALSFCLLAGLLTPSISTNRPPTTKPDCSFLFFPKGGIELLFEFSLFLLIPNIVLIPPNFRLFLLVGSGMLLRGITLGATALGASRFPAGLKISSSSLIVITTSCIFPASVSFSSSESKTTTSDALLPPESRLRFFSLFSVSLSLVTASSS